MSFWKNPPNGLASDIDVMELSQAKVNYWAKVFVDLWKAQSSLIPIPHPMFRLSWVQVLSYKVLTWEGPLGTLQYLAPVLEE